VVLLKLRNKLQPQGSLFVLYLALYAAWRLGIDFLRDGNVFLFGLHESQFISVIILLIAVPWLIVKTRWVKSNKQTPSTSATIKPD
jgi:phosphatidylglycerol:prolipoprotein diacylglycerol transferase